MHVLATVPVPRVLLVGLMDRLADAAATIEDQADGQRPLDNPDDLVLDRRQLICILSLEVAVTDLTQSVPKLAVVYRIRRRHS